ncbi:LysE family translocator [Devosia nitrariae]|uniref:Threonine/homoserine/homoserine lactone efflux protein n=1 Tax=Devosia nitrariae TaxID=2071872 RepID=A0ABQ5W5N5_9HYPH|nr:LysE family transporter [Devosia nitrariae]GLQ55106.1 hypothetical protein GCM10010862_23650 [Devosia nitrariae]
MSASPLLSASMLQFLMAYVVVLITPGPISFATGSLASLHGFGRTAPLLAGVGMGTAILATLMALGAMHLAGWLSIPVVKIVGAVALASIALHIARTAPPDDPIMEEPRKLHAGLFIAGLLLSLLAPQTASFFAISFTGLTVPIRDLVEALSVALISGILGVGWYALLALAFSRPSVRVVARRSHRVICWVAAALLALMALYSALSAFSSD